MVELALLACAATGGSFSNSSSKTGEVPNLRNEKALAVVGLLEGELVKKWDKMGEFEGEGIEIRSGVIGFSGELAELDDSDEMDIDL
jgi:hypothetical protein